MNLARASSSAIVIGGGVIGLFTAWRLRDAGFAVTVIDRGRIGGSASWAAGGILSPLPPWQAADAVWALAASSIKVYPDIAAQLHEATGIDPEWTASGMTVLEVDDIQAAQHWGREKAQAVLSAPSQRGVMNRAGLHLPWVAQVRSPRLLKALSQYLQQRGVVLLDHVQISHAEKSANSLASLSAGDGTRYVADLYVLCAGAWSGLFAGMLGPSLSVIQPVLGQMLLLQGKPGELQTIMLSKNRYLIPRRDGCILVGSTLESTGFNQCTTAEAREVLLADAHRILPETRAMPVIGHWCGLRPGTPQGAPLIQPIEDLKRVFVNAGHYRNGITLAPASADRLLAKISDQSKLC